MKLLYARTTKSSKICNSKTGATNSSSSIHFFYQFYLFLSMLDETAEDSVSNNYAKRDVPRLILTFAAKHAMITNI